MSADLFIVRPTLGIGGADRITVTLLRHLPREVFRPTLVLMRAEGAALSEVPEDIPVRSLAARSLWTAWLPLARLLRARRPEIVFSTSSGTNIIAVMAHLLAGRVGRVVLSERGMLRIGLSWKKLLQGLLKRVLYPRADHVTAVSRGVRLELLERLRLRPEAVSVVANPIVDEELERAAAEPVGHPWFTDGRPVIVTAGRLVAEKDHASLLEAFTQIAPDLGARLFVLGSGPLRADLERQVRRREVTARVELFGYDPNPFRYMARCTVFALSSRYEGLPGALIQAMALGAAVVATDCPSGPAEIITHEHDGLLVPVRDPGALAAAMSRCLASESLRARLGANARRTARRFSVEASLPLYIRALLGAEGARA